MSRHANPLIALVGAPGSGKTTWARSNFTPRQIVSSDEIRGRIGANPNDQRANPWTFQVLNTIVAGRMELDQLTVVDATHRTRKYRNETAVHAIRWSTPKFMVVFTTPLEVCLERNARRRGTRKVDETWLTDTHHMIAEALPPTRACSWEDYDGILFVPHEGPGCITGTLDLKKWASSPWLDSARETPPSYWPADQTYPGLRRVDDPTPTGDTHAR